MDRAEFIAKLPKAENHLHLEGAIPWAMVYAGAKGTLPERPEWWADDFRYDDFDHFGRAIWLGYEYSLKTIDDYQTMARGVFEALAAQNVRYTEVSIGTEVLPARGLPIAETLDAIKAVAPPSLHVALFAGFDRTAQPQDRIINEAFESGIVGIDLHAKEQAGTIAPYADVYKAAQARGLVTRAHAGELMGAAFIWETLDTLGVKRIEHGTRSVEDEALVERIAREGIVLDLCPTSNLKLRVVDSYAAHPIRHLFDRGVQVTVSSDDPTYFGASLTDELNVLVDHLGFTLAELAEVQKNAFRAASISDESRNAIFAEIDTLVEKLD